MTPPAAPGVAQEGSAFSGSVGPALAYAHNTIALQRVCQR